MTTAKPAAPVFALAAALVCLGAGATLAGCNLVITPGPTDYATPFPVGLEQTRDLDIQVVRRDTLITISNTTASPLPEGRLWVNQAFSRPVNELPIGESVTFNLYDFRNRFDEPFRAGGFFATQNPLDVVKVQWQSERELLGLRTTRGEATLR